METFSALLAICAGNSPVPGEFPAQMPVTRSFDAFFDLRLNKPLSKQSWGWWFETPSCPLWRHRNDSMHGLLTADIMSYSNQIIQHMDVAVDCEYIWQMKYNSMACYTIGMEFRIVSRSQFMVEQDLSQWNILDLHHIWNVFSHGPLGYWVSLGQ